MSKCVSNVNVYGLENAVRASKFPMSVNTDNCNHDVTNTVNKLATSDKGEGHDNWLVGVVVQFDLNFTVKAWTEAERYHFFDIISSQSTMHRIAKFDIDNSYIEYVDERMIKIMKVKVEEYNNNPTSENYLKLLYSNPCGFKLKAAITTNYRQLKTIYAQRKNHRLPEWVDFCEWIETLPNSYWITGNIA